MKWEYSVNQVIQQNWQNIQQSPLFNSFDLYHLNQLRQCRTAALGGHVNACDQCGHFQIAYNSCRNRHCPSCQGLKREEWILKQETTLLPVPYFHVVFTLPAELNGLCIAHPRLIYTLLFKCAQHTINVFAKDPKFLGAKTGMTAVLHTWGQNLSLHPHLHCIIPGGGINRQGKWVSTRSNGKYLFPRKAMRKVFKGKFLAELKDLASKGAIVFPNQLKEQLYRKKWVVYAKRPFANPKAVIEYLGRYTHKVAISNFRIKDLTPTHVTFEWKDYRRAGKKELMTLPVLDFLRRFCLHFLPDRFQRIRHYGFLSSPGRHGYIPLLQQQLGIQIIPLSKKQLRNKALARLKINNSCPCCQKGTMRAILPFGRDGPPDENYIFQYIARK